MPLMRVCAVNGMKCAESAAISRPRMPYFSFASTTMERPSGVSSESEASCAASARSRSLTPGERQELRRLAVAQRDRAGLVEQQRVDVAGRFDGAAGHGQHVEAHQPVHAGDADGRQQRADGGGDQRHEQRHQHQDADRAAGIGREARNRGDGKDEDDRHAGQQNVERDFVRRLLALGAFDQRDHAVEEGVPCAAVIFTLIQSEMTVRAAGDRRTVAAAFANDRRGLARDCRFVDRGDAFDHVAVAGDEIAGLDQHDVALLQLGGWHRARLGRRPCRAAWPSRRSWSGAERRPGPCRGLRRRLRRSSRTRR